jgi:uncharacterized protein YqgC (DUF456 family)
MAFDIVIMVLLAVLALAGWVLALLGISGTWLILVASVALDLATDGSWDFIATSIIFLVLCAAAEGAEFLAGVLGAKAFGGSRHAQIGAFIGSIAGGMAGSAILPIVGTILGVVAGGFAGALIGELDHQRRERESKGAKEGVKAGVRAGLGAAVARVVVIAMKVSLATLMLAWFVWVLVAHVTD